MKKFSLSVAALLVLCSLSLFAQSLRSIGYFVQGGQQAVTGSAVALPSFTANAICLATVSGGSQTVFIGGSSVTTSTGFPLAAGSGTCFPISNLNQLYVIAASTGSTVAWYGVTQ